jgi:hypothetical protein
MKQPRYHVHGAAYHFELLPYEARELNEDGTTSRELPSAKFSTPKQIGAMVAALVEQAHVSQVLFTRHGCWAYVGVPDDPEMTVRDHLRALQKVVTDAWEAAK